MSTDHRGVRAVQRLVEHAPASGSLALWMDHRDVPPEVDARGPWWAPEPDPSPVITDGRTLFYTRTFEGLSLARQTGWVAHVVLHVALRHVPRLRALQAKLGDVDRVLFNRCADAIVNTTLDPLRWLELPPEALRLERLVAEALGVSQEPEAALLAWDVERLYRAVDDRRPVAQGVGGGRRRGGRGDGDGDGDPRGHGSGRGEADTDAREPAAAADPADPDADGNPDRILWRDGPRSHRLRQLATEIPSDLAPVGAAEPPEAEAEAARDWAERLMRGHAGDGAFSMLRVLPADARASRTPWEAVLRVRMARALAAQPSLSWSRPSRSWLATRGRTAGGARLPWEPGRSASRRTPRLVLVIDVSGSVDDRLLARFRTEVGALVRRHAAALTVILGDDAVRAVRHHDPDRGRALDWDALLAPVDGGGGTDFGPLLAEADRHAPDLVVVLTDLDGPAGHRPAAPVVWAVPEPATATATATGAAWTSAGPAVPPVPFGRLLVLR